MEQTRGTLKEREPHPSAHDALQYIRSLDINTLFKYQGVYASCAIESNRLAEVCCETIGRLLDNKPVSDRYLLGLAWSIKRMEDSDE